MSEIIDKLRKNDFNRVEKVFYNCPICGSDLYEVENQSHFSIMDGNNIYQCENDIEHRFWRNPRERENILHLNKDSSKTNFYSEKNYKCVDGNWIVINKN